MATHNEFGKKGEDAAAEYLIQNGYNILARNIKIEKTEIDIIATRKNEIAFIEVKSRKTNNEEAAIHAIDTKRMQRLIAAADFYLQENNITQMPCFDIIAVFPANGKLSVIHIKDAFADYL